MIRTLVHLFALLLWTASAMFASRPATGPLAAPTASQTGAARDAATRLLPVVALDGAPAAVELSVGDMQAMLALAGYATGLRHAAVALHKDRADALVSLPVGARTYLNLHLSLRTEQAGVAPRWSAQLGALPLPALLLEPAAGLVARIATPPLPGPQRVVRRARITSTGLVVALAMPRSAITSVQSFFATGPQPVDADALLQLERELCRTETKQPSQTMAALLARALDLTPNRTSPERNLLALNAAAMLVVSPGVARVAAGVAHPLDPCIPGGAPVTLHGRADLAKHFLLSAVLASSIDMPVTRALGEYKELDDSLGGSGFSFVDLAADRAGERLGRMAGDPMRAPMVFLALSRARETELFPADALALRENMTDARFRKSYGTLDARRYHQVRGLIDAQLAELSLYR